MVCSFSDYFKFTQPHAEKNTHWHNRLIIKCPTYTGEAKQAAK